MMLDYSRQRLESQTTTKVISYVETNATNAVRFAAFAVAFMGFFFFFGNLGHALTGG